MTSHGNNVDNCMQLQQTRNSSAYEIANVNFSRRHLQPLTQCTPEATELGEITQKSAITPLKLMSSFLTARSRSFKVTNFGTNRKLICDFLLVINTNLPPILHHFRDIAFDNFDTKSLYLTTLLAFNPPSGGVPLGRS